MPKGKPLTRQVSAPVEAQIEKIRVARMNSTAPSDRDWSGRFVPGQRAEYEIRHYTHTTQLLIQRASFQRLARDIAIAISAEKYDEWKDGQVGRTVKYREMSPLALGCVWLLTWGWLLGFLVGFWLAVLLAVLLACFRCLVGWPLGCFSRCWVAWLIACWVAWLVLGAVRCCT